MLHHQRRYRELLDQLGRQRVRQPPGVMQPRGRPGQRDVAEQRLAAHVDCIDLGKQHLGAGVTIVGVARLFPPSGPLRPGSYDFSFESYFDRIGANGFFYRPPELVATSEAQGLAAVIRPAIDNFRNRVAGHVREAIGGCLLYTSPSPRD